MAIRFDHITLFSTAHYAYPSLAASGQRIKILSEHGNATFGSDNSSWFHINTDRQGVYFEKRIQTAVDMRSPVFYDSNDTNYYLNPGSTSNLNNLTIYGTLSASLPYSSLTGTPDIPSISGLATTGYVTTAINNLIASAPGTLDTLNELAAALGDDADFAGTVTNSLAGKLSTLGKAADSNLLDGLDSTQYLRSDVSDTHTATLTVNGQFIFNSSLNSSYREGIRLNVSTTGWGAAVIGGQRNSISGITDGWWVARNPSKDFVIAYGTSSNSGGLYLPYNSSALKYKNNRIWNASDFSVASVLNSNVTLSSLGALGTGNKAADSNLLDGYDQTDFIRIAANSNSPTNALFAIGSSGGKNFIQSHSGQILDINPLGNAVTVGSSLTLPQHLKATGSNLSFSAGGNQILNIDLNGKIYPATDASSDLGFTATSNRFRHGNFSGTVTSGNVTATSSVRAPIFYDSNDTGYYINPASTSTSIKGAGVSDMKEGFKSTANPWNTGDSAYFPNGITTAGGTNWIYGNTHIGNAPSNGAGTNFGSNGTENHISSQAGTSHGSSGKWLNTVSSGGNFTPYSFESERGNHSWGTVARFRINNSTDTDRPSIQFSSGQTETRWSIGYCAADDHFRIVQNLGYRNDNSTSDGWGTERLKVDTSGNLSSNGIYQSNASLRAPVFYDSNDTNYYINPNSRSRFNEIQTADSGATPRYDTAFYVIQGQHWYGDTSSQLMYIGESGNPVRLRGNLRIGSNANADSGMALTVSGDSNATTSFRAPIFYDSDNTGYYLNPNSDSNLYRGKFRANDQADNNYTLAALWTQNYNSGPAGIAFHISGNVGKLLEMRTNGILYWNNSEVLTTSSGYLPLSGGTLTGDITVGSGNTSSNIYMADSNGTARRIHTNSDRIGFLTSGNGWGSYCFSNGDWKTDMISYAGASMRAPIFYDSNDTGYYLNPASTSNLNSVNTNIVTSPVLNVVAGDNNGIGFWADQTNYTIKMGNNQQDHGTVTDYSMHFNMGTTAGRGFTFGSSRTAVAASINALTGAANFSDEVTITPTLASSAFVLNGPSRKFKMLNYGNQFYIQDSTMSTNRLMINGDGYVSINHTNPSEVLDVAGNGFFSGALKSLLLYDSVDTGYYLDLNGNSNLYGNITAASFIGPLTGNAASSSTSTKLSTAYVGGQQTNPQVYFNNSTGLRAAMTGAWSVWSDTLWINGYSGGDVLQMCALHTLRNGQPRIAISVQASTATSYGSFYELITEWSNHQTKAGIFQSNASLRAPIFYDSNNTGYYLDPASTSNINDLNVAAKRTDFSASNNWDVVGFGGMTNLHMQGHNQFWIGAGNGTWFTGTANAKSQASGLAADAPKAHDLLLSTMPGTASNDRGITFAVDSNGAGSAGWRLGKFHSGTDATDSMFAVDGQLRAKGGYTDEYDYYGNDYSSYYNDGQAHWAGDTNAGWHKPSIVASSAIQIQSGNGGTNSRKPQIQFHQYGYGGPAIEYDGPNKKLQIGMIGTSTTSRFNTFSLKFGSNEAFVVNTDYASHNSDMRAPIFYDTANTGFYTDPASTSHLNTITSANGITFTNNYGVGVTGLYTSSRIQTIFNMGAAYKVPNDGSSTANAYGLYWSHQNAGTTGGANNLASHGIIILEAGNYKGSWGGGRIVTTESVRAPIFYDSNDTNYYVNAASTTQLNHCKINSLLGSRNHVTGSYGWQIEQSTTTTNPVTFRFDNTKYRVYAGGGAGEIMTFLEGGNIGIGSTTPAYKLDVSGTIRATGDIIAYSDKRVKENIKTIPNALEKVEKLRGVEFNKIGTSTKSIGVIAQEIEEIIPEVVKTDSEGMKAVAYGNISGLLIEAIKEQQREINELKELVGKLIKRS